MIQDTQPAVITTEEIERMVDKAVKLRINQLLQSIYQGLGIEISHEAGLSWLYEPDTDMRSQEEIMGDIEQNRWTPPGAKSGSELLRELRDGEW